MLFSETDELCTQLYSCANSIRMQDNVIINQQEIIKREKDKYIEVVAEFLSKFITSFRFFRKKFFCLRNLIRNIRIWNKKLQVE